MSWTIPVIQDPMAIYDWYDRVGLKNDLIFGSEDSLNKARELAGGAVFGNPQLADHTEHECFMYRFQGICRQRPRVTDLPPAQDDEAHKLPPFLYSLVGATCKRNAPGAKTLFRGPRMIGHSNGYTWIPLPCLACSRLSRAERAECELKTAVLDVRDNGFLCNGEVLASVYWREFVHSGLFPKQEGSTKMQQEVKAEVAVETGEAE